MKHIFLFLIIFSVLGCQKKNKNEAEIEKIALSFPIDRFDLAFAQATPQNLQEIKNTYPVFFPKQFNDSVWLAKISDTLQLELNQEVKKAFPDNRFIEDALYPLFQHIKYYFPSFKTPIVLTTTTDVDYQNKVILADSLLVIGLDNYLGATHYFYEGIPAYVSKNLKKEQLSQDVASQYARQLLPRPRNATLLEQMIYYGKELYLKDLWLPLDTDAQKIGYTDDEMQWAKENEVDIWRYFVENETLYSTNPKLSNQFINPAPFSKFYLEIDNDSPGMIGRYVGWQIVKAFMDKTDTTLKQMLLENANKIYTNSKYKPNKN